MASVRMRAPPSAERLLHAPFAAPQRPARTKMGMSTEVATVRGSLRLAFGTLIALPTTMTFLGLSVLVVLGRSLTALGVRALAARG